MTWSIDRPVKTDMGAFRALSEQECRIRSFAGKLIGRGRKDPRVIILVRDGNISGMDMMGRQLSIEDIEQRFPGALETLRDQK